MTRPAWPHRLARPHSRAAPSLEDDRSPTRSRDSAHGINRFETPARLGVPGPSTAHVIREYLANPRPASLASPLRSSPAACNQPGAVQSIITSSPSLLAKRKRAKGRPRSEEHTSELQSLRHLVCRLL